MSNLIKQIVTVSELKAGDTVEIDGELKTVSNTYLKHCPFMGYTLYGSTFHKGVTKVTFKVPTAFGIRYE